MSRKARHRPNTEKENKWFDGEKSKFIWLTEQAQFISNRIGPQIANPRQGRNVALDSCLRHLGEYDSPI